MAKTTNASFPKLDQIKAGDVLIADGGFTCMSDGEVVTVKSDDGGLFVRCAGPDEGDDADADHGKPSTTHRREQHYLDGQEGDDGECVGLYRHLATTT